MKRAILPEGEHVRRAVRWISDSRRGECALTPLQLVSEANQRFDLTPLESEWMLRTFTDYAPERRSLPPRPGVHRPSAARRSAARPSLAAP